MPNILPIVLHPHPALRTKARPVETITDDIRATLTDMAHTMKLAHGVGLAANQVNILQRLVVLDFDIVDKYTDDAPTKLGLVKMVNPVMSDLSTDMFLHKGEGCLSVPDVYTEVERPQSFTLTYQDETGESHTVRLQNLAAAAVHHEIDHLDGLLFLDRIGKLKRSLLDKKYVKACSYFTEYPRYRILTPDNQTREVDLSGWKEE